MMETHLMRLNEEPFNLIKSGNKILELRLFDEKRKNVKLGDTLNFIHRDDPKQTISAKTRAIFLYNTFLELIDDLPIEWFGYKYKSDVINKVLSIYSPEQEQEYSVIGLKFEITKLRVSEF